jgi:ubiquinone/menaquinone biosynthesis C-methylase UbiE
MNVTHATVDEQTILWNGPAGRAWVKAQELLDHVFKPVEDLLVDAVASASASCVLDIGCGTGSTTLAAARLLGAAGKSIGIDISDPMIAASRLRAEREGTRASFICADAQSHPFAPASFDIFISRFGVMFFANPVLAFCNLRRAARENGELRFIAWRSAAENPFMTTAERAADQLLPNLPVRRAEAPGQFAFADQRRIRKILEASGWIDINIQRIDVACTLTEPELARYATQLGPVGLALQEVDDLTRERVSSAVLAAFGPYVRGTEVAFNAACWMVHARAPAGASE